MEETELRERLAYLAARTSPPLQDPDDLTAAVISRHHALRRRQLALAVVAAVVATVFVGIPVWLARTTDPGPADEVQRTGVYTTPTRGSRAHDVDFLEGVRRLSWTNGPAGSDVPEPPIDTRHVVWAGSVGVEHWVLVAGADPDQPLPPDQDGDGRRELDRLDSVAIAWFTGPPQAAPEEMTLFSVPRVVDADEPAAVTDSTGRAVIVAAPGDTIEDSGLVWVEPDGTFFRDYGPDPVSAPEGVAVTSPWPVEASIDRSMRYRVTRGSSVFEGEPDAYPNPDAKPPPDVEPARLRPAPPPAPGDAAVAAAIDDLLSRTGVVARVLSFTVVWAGDLPTQDGGSARLTLLVAEFPDDGGAGLYVTGALGHDAGGGTVESTSCGSETRPGGTPLGELVFVLRCDPGSGSGDAPTNSLVVVAPSGAATARALDDRGELIASYPVVDGVAVVQVPPGLASVEVIGADGETVDEREPMGEVDFDG